MEKTNEARTDALDQLKQAQLMISQGRKELAAANKKIKVAQQLIDASADALRQRPVDWSPPARRRPR
jgi:hypothetical protein